MIRQLQRKVRKTCFGRKKNAGSCRHQNKCLDGIGGLESHPTGSDFSKLRAESSQAREQGRVFATKGIKCAQRSICAEYWPLLSPKCGMEFEEG